MEVIIFMGVQATGKSSFYAARFHNTHLRLNMDMLKTRHREAILLKACIDSKARFVVDNTNPTREARQQYIAKCREAGYRIVGYYFSSSLGEAIQRNAQREGKRRVPDAGIRGTYSKLQLPERAEGYDDLFFVTLSESDGFDVQEWNDEV